MKLLFARFPGYGSGYLHLVDQHLHEDRTEGDSDENSVEFSKISFGCNQRCPIVAMSPPSSYPRVGSKSRSDNRFRSAAPSSLLDLIPHFDIELRPNWHKNKKESTSMFRSRSKRRTHKHSNSITKLVSKVKPPTPVTQSQPMACEAFDEMLRSNQTIYVRALSDKTTPICCHPREVLSSIPISAGKPVYQPRVQDEGL